MVTDLKITDLKIGEQFTELNTGNSSRASHVWQVGGPQGTYVARRPWWTNPEVNPFMDGLHDLFGVGGGHLETVATTYGFWRGLDIWKVSKTMDLTQVPGEPALKVEFIGGEAGGELADADACVLRQRVAAAHSFALNYFGPLTDTGVRG